MCPYYVISPSPAVPLMAQLCLPLSLNYSHYTARTLYCTLLYFTALCFTVMYFTALYFTALYCTALYFTALYFTALYLTILLLDYTALYSPLHSSAHWLATLSTSFGTIPHFTALQSPLNVSNLNNSLNQSYVIYNIFFAL